MTKSQGKRLRNRGRLVACAALVLLGIGSAAAQTFNFQLLAGGWTGDGGQASAADMSSAADLVFDKNGNLYVSQYQGNRIRKITPAGVITTVVGGNTGFAGDGGPASQALINHPAGLRFDNAGNLYFGDTGNRRVRRIATNGTITTIAGNGSYINSGDGGPATNAGIPFPEAIDVDAAGNVFVADSTAHVVRRITPAGIISTYAGSGVAGYTGDGGAATAAQLDHPTSIALDATGNLYIVDSYNRAVRRVSTTGTITTYAGDFLYPDSIEVDTAGTVYVGDDCTIKVFTGTSATTFGMDYCQSSPEGTPAVSADFGFVDGITVSAAGEIYFSDLDNGRIKKIAGVSALLTTYAGAPLLQPDGTPALSGRMSYVTGLAVDAAGSVYIADRYPAHRVRRLTGGKLYNFAGDGGVGSWCGTPCNPLFQSFPVLGGIATSSTGYVYIADRSNRFVARVKNGDLVIIAGGGGYEGEYVTATSLFLNPRGIATDGSDNLYIADYTASRIRMVDTATNIAHTIAGNGTLGGAGDGGAATSASVPNPTYLAVDSDGVVFFLDSRNVIRKVGKDGIVRRVAGIANDEGAPWPGGFSGEGGNALGAHLGNVIALAAHSSGVYFASAGSVRRVTPTGKIETIGGFPCYAYGLAIRARFLYVSCDNGRILRAQLPRITPNDFNGDAKSDLVWRDSASTNAMWLGAVNTTTQAIATNPSEWKLVGQGDFDADGKSDLVWRNTSTGANTIWRAGNTNTRIAVPTLTDQAWKVAGVGDFDGDGKSDLFWRNASTGAQQVWYSASAGTRLIVTTQADMQWVLGGVGDFDGDGKSDLLWRNTVTGANAIWRGANSQTPRAIAATNPAWKIAAVADFNGDGASDILWRNSGTGANTIWKSANNTRVQAVVGVTNPNWKVVAAGDYDNDGIADLVWRESNTGANTLWRNANNATQRTMPAVGIGWSVQPYEGQP